MRTIFSLAICLLLCQFASAQGSFAVRGGLDFAHQQDAYAISNSGVSTTNYNSNSRTGLQFGFEANVPLAKSLFFRQQFLYTVAGGKIPEVLDVNGDEILAATNYSLRYFQLPLQLVYSPSLPFGRPWIGFGVYGGLLLGGTVTSGGTSAPAQVGNEPGEFNRYDFGISPTVGVIFKNGILIGMDYQLGMVDANNNDASGSSLKSRNAILSVYLGYSWSF